MNQSFVNGCNCPQGGSNPTLGSIEMNYRIETPVQLIKGLDGKSAYQYAVEAGYSGTEEDFAKALAAIGQEGFIKDFGDGLELDENGVLQIDQNTIKVVAENVVTNEDIEVHGGLGQYNDKEVIPSSTPIQTILSQILSETIPPIYTKPKLEFSIEGLKDEVEIGEILNLKIKSNFIQNDAGSIVTNVIRENQKVINSGNIPEIESNFQIQTTTITFENQVTYSSGDIKNDNLGNPYPIGQIQAGMLSDSIVITGLRRSFGMASENPIASATSDNIRNFSDSMLGLEEGKCFEVNIPSGAKYVKICIPASLGQPLSIIQKSSNLDISTAFEINDIQVYGENHCAATDYKLYSYSCLIGLNKDKFIVEF